MNTNTPKSSQTLRLKANADKRIRGGHQWIYSNEIDTQATPLSDIQPGEQVIIESHQKRPLGRFFINPNTLICGRLISRDSAQRMDKSLLVHRLNIALSLRDALYDQPYYRWVYGDSDGLSGLIIDRFGDTIVVQINTAGMERISQEIISAIDQVCHPNAILLKNDGKMRHTEGLDNQIDVVKGHIDQYTPVIENGVTMLAPFIDGQKTGWFYDHRDARALLQTLSKDKTVLDVFSYVGGWGIQAAVAGATRVDCIDRSELALDTLIAAAEHNELDNIQCLEGEATQILQALNEDKEKYDIVVLDPPAFITRRKDIASGKRAYQKLNQLAMRLVKKDGLLISGSCSLHLQDHELTDIIRQSARQIDRQAQIFAHISQGADHPVHPAIPETKYLKAQFVRLTPSL